MYLLNKRQTEIISDLLDDSGFVSSKVIADRFKVSIRTIRYDLELIEGWLNENKVELLKVPNKGLTINATSTQKTALFEKLKFISMENRVFSEKERVKYIIIELLAEGKELTVEELGNRLFLSKNTIMKSIKETKHLLTENNLKLNVIHGKGVRVTGDEAQSRSLLVDLFVELFDANNIILSMQNKNTYSEFIEYCNSNFHKYNFMNMKVIYEAVIKLVKEYDFYLPDVALARLLVYLTITVKKNLQGEYIKNENPKIRRVRDYVIGSAIAAELAKYFSVSFGQEEIDEITAYLFESVSVSSIKSISVPELKKVCSTEAIKITESIIRHAEKELAINFSNDMQLFKGLVLYVNTAIARARNCRQFNCDYVNKIINRYPIAFQIVKESFNGFDECYHLDDSELANITLHIRAAYERKYHESVLLTALVICNEGFSMLTLLTTMLKINIPELRVIETCSTYDFEKYRDNIDFVITTGNFKANSVEVIKVSPFLDNSDIYNIKQTVTKLNKFKQIYKYSKLKNMKGGRIVLLRDLLNDDMVELKVKAEDWEDAVSKAAVPLVKHNKIKQGYVDNMIQVIKDLGPYIVIMPGIAFAHSRPDETVLETCLSMITLDKPVCFGSEPNDPVSIVFAFGAKSGNEHMKAMQDLAKFLSIEENVRFLNAEADKKIVLERLLEY